MGKKRDFEEVGSPEHGSPEPQGSNGAAPFKKQKHYGKSKHRPNEGSSQWAKKRARNIERLLNRKQDLPANVRNDLERELAAHQNTVSDKSFQRKRSAMISKYHMVRFFERKRAMRLAKQLRKKLEQTDSPEETEELKRYLHIAEVDEAYTQHFPHIETYISLYKMDAINDNDDEDKAAKTKALLTAERPAMWSTIEEAMKQGSYALRAIREKRTSDESQEGGNKPQRRQQKPKPATKPAESAAKTQPKQQPREKAAPQTKAAPQVAGAPQPGMNRRERRRLMREAAPQDKDDDEDSDGGGFFDL